MPRASTQPQPVDLASLINSTTYPPVPSLDDLEALRASITDRRKRANVRLKELDPKVADEIRKERQEKKRRENDMTQAWEEKKRAKAEAEAAAAAQVQAREQGQAQSQGMGMGQGSQGQGSGRGERDEEAKVKRERMTVSPAPSNVSATSGRPAAQGLPTVYTSQHKKKKQKRILDSDDEAQHARATPTSPPHTTQSSLKLKLAQTHAKSRPSTSTSLPFSGADEQPIPLPASAIEKDKDIKIDFSLPASATRPLIPPRPGVARPPKPGPKKQSEVAEDYSNVKAPNQVGLPTFWNSVEPYLREIREDDLAMLGFKAAAPESMEIPPRGRHYADVWDEEDGAAPGTTPRVSVPNLRQLTGDTPATANGSSRTSASTSLPPAWHIADMPDIATKEEMRGLGNISERLIAAIIPDGAEKMDERAKEVEGRYGQEWEERPGEGLAVRINARELEERVKKELRGVMLLGEHEEFDPSKRDDDEITSSLRQCQRLLEAQISLNEQRKSRLVSQAKNRLAYAEYQTRLDGVEKGIEAAWAKRVKKHGFKNKSTTDKHGNVIPRPPVPDTLKALVETRRKWVYGNPPSGEEGTEGYSRGQKGIGELFRDLPLGQVRGLPAESIYEGLGSGEDEREEEEVQAALGMDVD